MGKLHKMSIAMGEHVAVAHRMMERMEQRNKEHSYGHNGGAEVNLEYLKFAKCRKENSPSFRGAYNPNLADEWIKSIEKIFTVLACTEELKIAFATYMLEIDVEF